MTNPFFSIIIVTWNGLELLKKYLPSVIESNYSNFEIIIADNASTDKSVEWITKNYSTIKIVSHDKNYGYCGGNNRAVEAAIGDVLLFLNNDVEVDANWLTAIANCFENDKTGVVQPKILSYNNPHFFEYAGAAGGFIDKYGFPFCQGRLFDTVEPDDGQYNKTTQLFWASGAAFAIRTNLFKNLGGFDERFEFHMEEIDLCWRVIRAGFDILYTPDSAVYHLGGASLPMGSPRKLYYNFRNSLFMLAKNVNSKAFKTLLLQRIMIDFSALLQQLVMLNVQNVKAIITAYKDAFALLDQFKTADTKQQMSLIDTIYPKSVILDYFLFRRHHFSDLSWKRSV